MALIDRDALVDSFCKSCPVTDIDYCRKKDPCKAYEFAYQQPVVDAKPVVHGGWVSIGGKGMKSCVQSCTACNRCSPFKTPFCPNCGADMR